MVTELLAYNSQLAPDALLVVIMLAVEVFLLTQIVPRNGATPTLTRMIIGSTALLGSAGVLMAVTGAFLTPTLGAYSIVLMTFNFMMMGPPGLWMIAVIIFEDRKIAPDGWTWPAAVAGMATFGELMMGLFFAVAGGASLDPVSVLVGTLTSAWFVWSMVGAMVALTLWVRLPGRVRVPLVGLAAGGFLGPWVTAAPAVGALLMTAAMGLTFLFLFTGRQRAVADPRYWSVALGVGIAFLAMTIAGLVVALSSGNVAAELAFGVVMAVVMTGEMLYLVREGLSPSTRAEAGAPLPTVATATAG
ncbi:MAG TPA: hypothetical protein VGV89_01105 [Thermoplasmata archaeon]|nr:hypothetical protein [Thermoplasmata archaeon]